MGYVYSKETIKEFSAKSPKLIEVKNIRKGQLVYNEDPLGFLSEFECVQPVKGTNGVGQFKLINTDFPDGKAYIGKIYKFTEDDIEFVDAPFKYDSESDKFKAYSPKWISVKSHASNDSTIPSNVIEYAKELQKLALDDFKKNGKKYIKEENNSNLAWYSKNSPDKVMPDWMLIPENAKITADKETYNSGDYSAPGVDIWSWGDNSFGGTLFFDIDADYQCGHLEENCAKSIESKAVQLLSKFGLEPDPRFNKKGKRFLTLGDDYFAIEFAVKEK